MLRSTCLLFCLLLLYACAHAQVPCPWLTQGTAAAWLQGPVAVSTNLSPNGDGSCIFTLHQGAASSTLQITVTTANQPACPAGRPLTGIGNQAVLCSTSPNHNRTTDTLSSRVRDRYLTVELTNTGKAAAPLISEQRKSLVQQAAEEVAGNLF